MTVRQLGLSLIEADDGLDGCMVVTLTEGDRQPCHVRIPLSFGSDGPAHCAWCWIGESLAAVLGDYTDFPVEYTHGEDCEHGEANFS